jgi:hypothetical protein
MKAALKRTGGLRSDAPNARFGGTFIRTIRSIVSNRESRLLSFGRDGSKEAPRLLSCGRDGSKKVPRLLSFGRETSNRDSRLLAYESIVAPKVPLKPA